MKILSAWLLILLICSLTPSILLAQAESADAAAPGATGVNSAWDQENIDILTGTLSLYVPLYTAHSGDMSEWSVGLSYSSDIWDATDSNYPNTPSARHIHGFGPVGLGWKIGFGRVYALTYSSGGTTEVQYYVETQRGGTHRLFRKAAVQGGSCQPEPYWYAFDGSGIRAQSTPSDPLASPSTTTWTVWLPDGTTLSMARYRSIEPGIRNQQGFPENSYDGWDTTNITGPQPKNGGASRYSISISYYSDASGMSLCPQTVTDMDNPSRVVRFTCIQDYYNEDNDGSLRTFINGVVTSVEVPAPNSPTGTQVYDLTYDHPGITDPFLHDTNFGYILQLRSVTASGVTPLQRYWFFYEVNNPNNLNYGLLTSVTLPFGEGIRGYQYGVGNVWWPSHPIIFDGTLSGQFGYFPVVGVTWRAIYDFGTSTAYWWDYSRLNTANCEQALPGGCYRSPATVRVTGPYKYNDPTVSKSLTIYTYNGTAECSSPSCSPGSENTPGPRDGTLAQVQAYAGPADSSPLLRTTSYEYSYDTPNPGCMVVGTFNKDHYADNLRITRTTTSFNDDGKSPHDLKVTEYANWIALTTNFGRFQDVIDYQADGVTSYRRTTSNFTLSPGQLAAWILTPIKWQRILDGSGNVKQETDYTSDDYGRPTTVRKLFAPGASPQATGQDDLLTTLSYDSSTGNQSGVVSQIPRQGVNLGSTTLGWSAGYPTRKQISGLSWYSMDVDREPNWGLPTAVRRPDGTGVSVGYDSIGRQTTIRPLPGSGDPPVDITYERSLPNGGGPFQVTTVVGDALSSTSIQTKQLLDGFGRVQEEQILNPAGQWESRQYTRDAVGNVVTVSEWAPVGTTGPVTTTQRFGTYDGSGNVYFDPFLRVRKTVTPDGGTTLKSYEGLVTTTTVQGIQGGSASAPTSINSVTKETYDVFGRLVNVTTKVEDPPPPASPAPLDRSVDYTYDVLDHRLETKTEDIRVLPPATPVYQVKSAAYDALGRLTMLNEPERGKIWIGTVNGGGSSVGADGYDALGNVIRYEDAYGYAAVPSFHYRKTYDAAGRPTKLEKEEDATLTRATISEATYDCADSSHGDGNSQKGQLCIAKGYDDATVPALVAQTDYYYNGPFGRFDKMTSVVGGWGTGYSTYYTYDSLGQVSSVGYPTTGAADPGTGLPDCTSLTCLTLDRSRGMITHVGSSRGYDMVTNALYNDAGNLQEWVSGNGMRTQIVPDPNVKSRPQEIKVLRVSNGSQAWSSGMYAYDGAGLIKGIGSDIFTYDSLGRLKEAQLGPSGGTVYNQGAESK